MPKKNKKEEKVNTPKEILERGCLTCPVYERFCKHIYESTKQLRKPEFCYNRKEMSMNFNEYQEKAYSFFVGSSKEPWIYFAFGLAGETGEVLEKLKRTIRNGDSVDRDLIKKELGDVLWYLACLAKELGFSLEDIAKDNIDKLSARKEQNKITGSGDRR